MWKFIQFASLAGINCKEVQTGTLANRREGKLHLNRSVMGRG